MVIAIIIICIVFPIAWAFFKSVKKNVNQIYTDKLIQQREQCNAIELNLVAQSQPLRCLEFFFNNQFSPENHMLNYYSVEQQEQLKDILVSDYGIIDRQSLNDYRAKVLFKLLSNHLSSAQLVKLLDIEPNFLDSSSGQRSAAEYQAILSRINLHTFDDALNILKTIRPKKVNRILAVDNLASHIAHIETMYKAHIYCLAYEVGYITRQQLQQTTANIASKEMNWKMYDHSFTLLNQIMDTGTFVHYMIMRKKNKVCWHESGVWMLQQLSNERLNTKLKPVS